MNHQWCKVTVYIYSCAVPKYNCEVLLLDFKNKTWSVYKTSYCPTVYAVIKMSSTSTSCNLKVLHNKMYMIILLWKGPFWVFLQSMNATFIVSQQYTYQMHHTALWDCWQKAEFWTFIFEGNMMLKCDTQNSDTSLKWKKVNISTPEAIFLGCLVCSERFMCVFIWSVCVSCDRRL